eukprot:scaffold261032_cov20-Tisochrysis_lutea.AAC.1
MAFVAKHLPSGPLGVGLAAGKCNREKCDGDNVIVCCNEFSKGSWGAGRGKNGSFWPGGKLI